MTQRIINKKQNRSAALFFTNEMLRSCSKEAMSQLLEKYCFAAWMLHPLNIELIQPRDKPHLVMYDDIFLPMMINLYVLVSHL